ncbi:hypothetical protein Tco_0558116 [Tanacetum coccineum]
MLGCHHQTHPNRVADPRGDDDGGMMMVTRLWWGLDRGGGDGVAAAAAGGGGRKWRLEESDLVGRIDRLMRIIFGVGRKSPPENFSGGGDVVAGGGLAGEDDRK